MEQKDDTLGKNKQKIQFSTNSLHSHREGFELETEFDRIWDQIRYKKIDELYTRTLQIIEILDSHLDDELLFHSDYAKIQDIFSRMKRKNYFYQSASAKELLSLANPKFKHVFKYRKCKRNLRYTGESTKNFTNGKIYKSSKFNGATYIFHISGAKVSAGCNYFERLD